MFDSSKGVVRRLALIIVAKLMVLAGIMVVLAKTV
jgi:hypothetical protein